MADDTTRESPAGRFFDARVWSQKEQSPKATSRQRLPGRISKLTSRMQKLFLLSRNWRQHLILSRTIETAVSSGIIVEPRHRSLFGSIKYKYLKPYLSLDLTHAERFSALQSHHLIIIAASGAAGATARPLMNQILWENPEEQNSYLLLEQSTDCRMEGELTISFFFQSQRLYWITLSVFDGRCINFSNGRIVFIGGVQGLGNSKNQVRAAAKSNGEIAPLDLLMIAVRSLANRFQAEKIIGVTKANHVAHAYAPDDLLFDYDGYWASLSGSLKRVGYVLDVEPPQKPLSEVSATHRSRTRRKRELKRTIRGSIDERADALFPGAGGPRS